MQFPIDTLGDAAVPHKNFGQFLSERLFEDQENTKQQETAPHFKKHLKTLRRDFI